MKKKVAIFGIGHFGKFHIREFLKYDCKIEAILCKTKESIPNKLKLIKNLYDIIPKAYCNADELLQENKIDIVSICTPDETHEKYIKICLNYKVSIFCEKPILLCDKNINNTDNLIYYFKKCNNLTQNTQLITILPIINKFINEKIDSLEIMISNNLNKSIKKITSIVPHLNSILIELLGVYDLNNLNIDRNSIKFKYNNVNVNFILGNTEVGKKNIFYIKINQHKFERFISDDYKSQYLIYNNKKIDIEDPLSTYIRNFVNNNTIKPNNIIHNYILMKKIIDNY